DAPGHPTRLFAPHAHRPHLLGRARPDLHPGSKLEFDAGLHLSGGRVRVLQSFGCGLWYGSHADDGDHHDPLLSGGAPALELEPREHGAGLWRLSAGGTGVPGGESLEDRAWRLVSAPGRCASLYAHDHLANRPPDTRPTVE